MYYRVESKFKTGKKFHVWNEVMLATLPEPLEDLHSHLPALEEANNSYQLLSADQGPGSFRTITHLILTVCHFLHELTEAQGGSKTNWKTSSFSVTKKYVGTTVCSFWGCISKHFWKHLWKSEQRETAKANTLQLADGTAHEREGLYRQW